MKTRNVIITIPNETVFKNIQEKPYLKFLHEYDLNIGVNSIEMNIEHVTILLMTFFMIGIEVIVL